MVFIRSSLYSRKCYDQVRHSTLGFGRKIAIIFPDTSPRSEGVPDDDNFDLGPGAGFYVNSTENPWKKEVQMYYIVDELPNLVFKEFPINPDKQSIMGHSMGGLGALNIAFRNPEIYKTVSAFAPISNR